MGEGKRETRKRVSTPKQRRGVEKKERILEAAERLFAKKGFHSTNSKEIVAEAGVSIGTFYRYFEDKRSLFLEVLDRHHNQAIQEVFERHIPLIQEARDERQLLQQMLQATLAAHALSPDFHREADAMRYLDDEVRRRHEQMEEKVQERTIMLLRSLGDKVRVSDYEAAAIVVGRAIEAVIHSIKIFGVSMGEERLLDALADMLFRYLFGGEKTGKGAAAKGEQKREAVKKQRKNRKNARTKYNNDKQ